MKSGIRLLQNLRCALNTAGFTGLVEQLNKCATKNSGDGACSDCSDIETCLDLFDRVNIEERDFSNRRGLTA
jgi:hypothetical protein